jgi:hypothetical protein
VSRWRPGCSTLQLSYNQADLLLPDLLVCRPEFAEVALAVLR